MIRRTALVLLLAGAQLLTGSSLAVADEVEPSVSFLDDRAASVKLSQLQEGLTVPLHNDLSAAQKLTLRIVGTERSDNADVQKLFPTAGVTSDDEIAPGGVEDLTLPPARSDVDLTEGSFEAVLVASGSRGGPPARLPLTIEFGQAAPDGDDQVAKDEPAANVLRPDKVLELTLVAVNFLPSPLAAVGSLILFLAIAGGLLVFLLRDQLARKNEALPRAGFVLAGVALIAAAVVFAKADSFWTQPSAHKIVPRPIDVSSSVADGNVGSAASANGKLAQLVVEKNEVGQKELLPKALDAAGSYSGTYDLTPGVEKGDAKVTINVRDFWIYAFVTIVLGLLIAYLLHLWFKSTRPTARLKLNREELENEYEQEKEAFEKSATSPPPPLERKFELLHERTEEDLDEGDVKAAREKLAGMRAFLDGYHLLLVSMARLQKGCAELRRLHASTGFGVSLGDVDPHEKAIEVSARTERVSEEGGEELAATRKEVEEAAGLVRGVVAQLKSISRQLALAETLATGEKKESVEKISARLKTLGREALEVDSNEDLKKVEGTADTTLNELLAIEEEVGGAADREIVISVGESLLYSGIGTTNLVGNHRRLYDMFATRQSPPAGPPTVTIAWRRRDEKEFGQPKVYKGDRVWFEVTVDGAGPGEFEEVRLDFGDGQSQTLEVHAGQGRASHRYRSGGSKTVSCTALDGTARQEETIEVDLLSKPERGKIEISDRDRIAAVAAFVLAVASGMTTLYLADASWGEPADYLGALLWGGLTGEGVKLATAIADRAFPGT